MHSDGSINGREVITTYGTSGKNNTWLSKQSMLQPSGKKEALLGRSSVT
jgi:hypothetical protein